MENIIPDNQIDPVTANLVGHIKGCRPSINRAMGWSTWRKSLRYYTMPRRLANLGPRGMVGSHIQDTYAELVDVLPEKQTYPWDMSFFLSPFGALSNRNDTAPCPYWKYIRLYYINKRYDWTSEAGPTISKEEVTFAVWGRDGRVRLASSRMRSLGKIMTLKNRINVLFGLGWERTDGDRQNGRQTPWFEYERRKLQLAIPTMGTEYWDSIGYIPIVDGDIFDVKTNKLHSRLLEGKPPMSDIMSDISPTHSIPDGLRRQFREAPSNPTIRSAIRAEINTVVPSDVQDEQALDNFFRQRRTVLSEGGVFAL